MGVAHSLALVAMAGAASAGSLTMGATGAGAAQPGSGDAYSWGSNSSGQFGNGTTTNSSVPVPVDLPAGIGVTAIASGAATNYWLGTDGNVYAAGASNDGQLGNGTTTSSTTPVKVSLPSGVTATAVASAGGAGISLSGYAIGSDGNTYAWGYNRYGELGNGNDTNSTTPVAVELPDGVTFTQIGAGDHGAVALGSDGNAYTWGSGYQDQLGNGTTTSVLGGDYTPVEVLLPFGVTATAVAAGNTSNYAIGSDGNLYAWGTNSQGELGNGTTTSSDVPVVVHLPAGVHPVSISAGTDNALALGSDGNLYAWGDNAPADAGQTDILTPTAVPLPGGVSATQVAGSEEDALAIGSDGNVYAWGDDGVGEFGNGTISSTVTTSPTTAATAPAGLSAIAIQGANFGGMAIFAASPGNGLPESPVTVTLPLAAAALIGGLFLLRRRKNIRSA